MKIKENFASHTLHCNICKKEGSIIYPNPSDYCSDGYKLLIKEINNMEEMIKLFTSNL